MMSLIPWTPWRSTSSTTRKASMIEVFFWTTSLRRSFGIVIRVSTWAFSSSAAFSATSLRLAPSNANGLVTTPIVSAPGLLGDLGDDRRRAGAGAAAQAGGDEDHVRVLERLGDLLGVLLGRPRADRRVAAGTEAARDLVADPDLVRRVGLEERLGVRVAGDELDAHHLGPDHPVDGVAPAAADADDADQREVLGIGPQRHRLPPGLDGCSVVTAGPLGDDRSTGARMVAGRRGILGGPSVAASLPPARNDATPVRRPASRSGAPRNPCSANTAFTRWTPRPPACEPAGRHRLVPRRTAWCPGGERALGVRARAPRATASALVLALAIGVGRDDRHLVRARGRSAGDRRAEREPPRRGRLAARPGSTWSSPRSSPPTAASTGYEVVTAGDGTFRLDVQPWGTAATPARITSGPRPTRRCRSAPRAAAGPVGVSLAETREVIAGGAGALPAVLDLVAADDRPRRGLRHLATAQPGRRPAAGGRHPAAHGPPRRSSRPRPTATRPPLLVGFATGLPRRSCSSCPARAAAATDGAAAGARDRPGRPPGRLSRRGTQEDRPLGVVAVRVQERDRLPRPEGELARRPPAP